MADHYPEDVTKMTDRTCRDFTCVGSATEDVFVSVPDAHLFRVEDRQQEMAYLALEYGAKIRVGDVHIDTGGGATNTAVTFARMGLKTGIVTKIGVDGPGDRVIAGMGRDGIETGGVVRDTEHRTGYSVIITGFTGDRTILVYRGASAFLRESEIDWDYLARTSWVYMNSMAGETAAVFPRILEFCGERGIHVALNPGKEQRALGMAGLAPYLRNVTLLVCNRSEAYEITGVPPDRGPGDEERMLKMLLDAGCANVVLTYGSEGSEGMNASGHWKVPVIEGPVVSTVGAGDAFAAACAVGLHRGLGLEQAMRIGTANAASVVQVLGAKNGILTWEQAQAALQG